MIDAGKDIDTVSYESSPNASIVNIDEILDYQNSGAPSHTSIITTVAIPSDLEPAFNITAGTAQDGFGTLDILRNVENILGTSTDDILIGNAENNQIDGLAGNDLFIGNAGADIFHGGEGDDTNSYRRDPASVTVNLNTGLATDGFGDLDSFNNIENALGSGFDDSIIGSPSANKFFADGGNDYVAAQDGDDILFGESGQDTLFGEAGDDFLVGGPGADSLDGGVGKDTASYFTATEGVKVSLQARPSNKGIKEKKDDDILFNIENLEGSEHNDFLTGDSGDNILSGLGGHDHLEGKDGNNTLFGGTGHDHLQAGNGSDFLSGGEGNDHLDAAGGNDSLLGGDGRDFLNGKQGDDSLDGGAGDDRLLGQSGDDTIDGNIGHDIIFGSSGQDLLFGGLGNDRILGGAHQDSLLGDAGADIISGGPGNDFIDGGEGDDTLLGDQGSDIFVLSQGQGVDKIMDFKTQGKNKDFLELEQLSLGQLSFQQVAKNTIISVNGSEEILAILIGVKANTISNSFL